MGVTIPVCGGALSCRSGPLPPPHRQPRRSTGNKDFDHAAAAPTRLLDSFSCRYLLFFVGSPFSHVATIDTLFWVPPNWDSSERSLQVRVDSQTPKSAYAFPQPN